MESHWPVTQGAQANLKDRVGQAAPIVESRDFKWAQSRVVLPLNVSRRGVTGRGGVGS